LFTEPFFSIHVKCKCKCKGKGKGKRRWKCKCRTWNRKNRRGWNRRKRKRREVGCIVRNRCMNVMYDIEHVISHY
jgi:hypothetical protein